MPEPVRCTACRRPYNRQFTKCPFCNAPNTEAVPQAAIPDRQPASEGPLGLDYPALATRAIALAQPFVRLDFHPAAITALDHFIDQTWGDEGAAPDAEAWQPSEGQRVVIAHFGAFFGELLRRELGGRWQTEPSQPANALLARVVLPGGQQVFTLARAFGRLKNGARDRLEPLYRQARQAAGVAGSPTEAEGWVRYARDFEGLGRPDLALSYYDHALALALQPAARAEIQARRAAAASVATAQGATAPQALSAQAPVAPRPARTPSAPSPPASPAPAATPEKPASLASASANALATAIRAHAARAAAFTGEARHAEALAELDHLLGLAPSNAGGLLARAGALISLGREREALAGLEEIAGRNDCEPKRSLLAAIAADRLGEAVKAERAFRAVKNSPALSPEQRSLAAERAAALARDPAVRLEAIEALPDTGAMMDAYERLSTEHPELAAPIRERGVGLAMQGRAEEALACFERAAAIEPKEPTSYDHKAVTLLRLQRVDDALRALDEGLRHCPASGTLHCRRGICSATAGRNDEALAAFRRSLEVDPEHAEAWAYKGDVEARGGDTPAAISSLGRFLAARAGRREKLVTVVRRQLWGLRNPGRSPDEARGRACLNAGLAAVLAGKLDEARARLDEGLAADPLSGELWLNHGATLLRLSCPEAALVSFQRAEELLGPMSQVIQGEVACLLGLGRADDALRCHDRHLAQGPANPDALHAKARTLVQLGRVGEALPLYGRLVARGPANLAWVSERADALVAAGRETEARYAYDAALALAPGDAALLAKRERLGQVPTPAG
jgi:tetratricopeptide (TPR) repeat protein